MMESRRQRADTACGNGSLTAGEDADVNRINNNARAFTLIEVLVVIAIIAVLIAVLVPALSGARERGRATACLANLRTLGQGLIMYCDRAGERMLPGRLPKLDNDHWRAQIKGGWKYRPTFLAMMGSNVGIKPFEDPMPSKTMVDRYGQDGDRQDYSSNVYVCPAVPDWTDERNGSYGYNYQFLGNSRLRDSSDPTSFKNWPVRLGHVAKPSSTVAVGDCMGTAAGFATHERAEYLNNSRDSNRYGNEGFNLDPPRIDAAAGEIADHDGYRSAAHDRHLGRANILWMDAHADSQTLEALGYRSLPDGTITHDGDNSLWSLSGRDEAWLAE